MTRVRHRPRTFMPGHGLPNKYQAKEVTESTRTRGQKTPCTLDRSGAFYSSRPRHKRYPPSRVYAIRRGVLGRGPRQPITKMHDRTHTTVPDRFDNTLTWSTWSTPPQIEWTIKNRKTRRRLVPGGPLVQCKYVTVGQRERVGRRRDRRRFIEHFKVTQLHWTTGPSPRSSSRRRRNFSGPHPTPGEWTTWTTLSEVTR